MEKLWTTAEAAQCLGITEVDVEELVRQGTLTGYKLGGKFLRFRPSQVEQLKGAMRFRPQVRRRRFSRPGTWASGIRDFLYFYDFYLVSAVLVAALVVYLIASG
jgi:excisionase family DNA binding protein